MNPFSSPQFKKLAKEWNKKLEESGHKEIEDFNLPDPPLLRNESAHFRNINHAHYAASVLYYEKARDLLNTFNFYSKLHRRIWEMHSEGVSAREIAKAINQRKVRKSTVHNILKQIQKEIK